LLVGGVCSLAAVLLLRAVSGWRGWTPLLSTILFPAGSLLALFIQLLWLHQVSHAEGAELLDMPLAASASPSPAITLMLAAFGTASLLWPGLKGVFGSRLATCALLSIGVSFALGAGWWVGFVGGSRVGGSVTGSLLVMGALMGATSGGLSGLVAAVLLKGGGAKNRSQA
jgi:hypothetical protein